MEGMGLKVGLLAMIDSPLVLIGQSIRKKPFERKAEIRLLRSICSSKTAPPFKDELERALNSEKLWSSFVQMVEELG